MHVPFGIWHGGMPSEGVARHRDVVHISNKSTVKYVLNKRSSFVRKGTVYIIKLNNIKIRCTVSWEGKKVEIWLVC